VKREAFEHPKTMDLMSRLGIDQAKALGTLAMLWNWTADHAIQGNIGKWPDGAIARGCSWDGEASVLVRALVDSRWLDENADHRLLVHDWPDHCERWVKAKLVKMGKWFVEAYAVGSTVRTVVGSADATAPRDPTQPIQTNPNPTNPATGAAEVEGASWESVSEAVRRAGVADHATAVSAAITNGLSPSDVQAIVNHWWSRKPAWKPDGLHWRIRTAQPGESPADRWPPPSPEAELFNRSAAASAKVQRQARDRAAVEAERANSEARKQYLESRFGPTVDAMTPEQVIELLPAMQRVLYRKDPKSHLVRDFLLNELKTKQSLEAQA